MATQKKFLVYSFILAVVIVMTTGIHAFAKSGNVTGRRAVESESVTGSLQESFVNDRMKFMRVAPTGGGDDVWVTIFEDTPVSEDRECTFKGPVFKDYKVKILKRKFKKIIFSESTQCN